MRPLVIFALLAGMLAGCAAGTSRPATRPSRTSTPSSPASTSVVGEAATAGTARCASREGLPDHVCTPGLFTARVAQENVASTICTTGYSALVRPPTSVTDTIKIERMAAYGLTGAPADYELDHLIPLELGGSPTAIENLWPQSASGLDASRKDQLEDRLHDLVCARRLSLSEAQAAIATDWIAAAAKYVTSTPTPTRIIVPTTAPTVAAPTASPTARSTQTPPPGRP